MFKDMLGQAVRKLVALPEEHLGVAHDLLEKLADPQWIEPGKKFLRKEPCWVTGVEGKRQKGRFDPTRLRLLTGVVLDIPAITPQSGANPFAIQEKDAASPFGYRSLTTTLDPGGRTRKVRAQGYELLVPMNTSEIAEAAGGAKAVLKRHLFTPEQIRRLVDNQTHGGADPLLRNGFANIFPVLAADGSLAFVLVSWRSHDRHWHVWSFPLMDLGYWGAGRRLFLCT